MKTISRGVAMSGCNPNPPLGQRMSLAPARCCSKCVATCQGGGRRAGAGSHAKPGLLLGHPGKPSWISQVQPAREGGGGGGWGGREKVGGRWNGAEVGQRAGGPVGGPACGGCGALIWPLGRILNPSYLGWSDLIWLLGFLLSISLVQV